MIDSYMNKVIISIITKVKLKNTVRRRKEEMNWENRRCNKGETGEFMMAKRGNWRSLSTIYRAELKN
jgi:hypothetical protein